MKRTNKKKISITLTIPEAGWLHGLLTSHEQLAEEKGKSFKENSVAGRFAYEEAWNCRAIKDRIDAEL